MIPFAVLVPISVLCLGLVNKFVDGNLGLALSLVSLFFNGGGVSEKQHKQAVLHFAYLSDKN